MYRFPGPVVPDNERERLVEFDDMRIVWTEAPDALDEHLHACHDSGTSMQSLLRERVCALPVALYFS